MLTATAAVRPAAENFATAPVQQLLTFADLYENYGNRVYGVCHRIMSNYQDAMDAAQETFATIHRRMAALRTDDNVAGWVHRVAVNTCLSIKRRQKARPAQLMGELTDSGDQERETGRHADGLL